MFESDGLEPMMKQEGKPSLENNVVMINKICVHVYIMYIWCMYIYIHIHNEYLNDNIYTYLIIYIHSRYI